MLLDQIIDILVQALQGVILAVITFACVKWVIPYIKKITQNEIVKQAVQAAEKIYQDSGMGEKKREYVIDALVSTGLFKLEADGSVPKYWDMAIESAVKALDLVESQIGSAIDEISEDDENPEIAETEAEAIDNK